MAKLGGASNSHHDWYPKVDAFNLSNKVFFCQSTDPFNYVGIAVNLKFFYINYVSYMSNIIEKLSFKYPFHKV